jgi:D-threonate/D-erythronate kinase
MQVLIIADDLTGALDSAVTLADVGMRCRVARRPGDVAAALEARPDVLAVSTASREGSGVAAREAVGRVFDAVPDGDFLVFKKIDSRLKGQIAAELAVVGERTGIARAVVAPAIPAQGRATERGRLTGAGVGAPIDVAAALGGSGLAVEVPDTRTDGDLDGVVAAALAGPPTLLVGAAGLAAALGRRLRPGAGGAPVGRLPPPLLLAIGSRDPITLAQIEVAHAAGLVREVAAPDGGLSGPVRMPADGALLLRLVTGAGALEPGQAGPRFARSVAALLRSERAGSLFACGGETADAILGELGVGVLAVEGELLPGVPVSTMVVNEMTMRLITKSGGFGAPDTLAAVVEAVAGGRKEGGL